MNVDDVEKLIMMMQRYELTELNLKEKEWEFAARRGDKNAPQPAQVLVAPPMMAGTPGSSPHLPALPGLGSGINPVPPAPPAESGKNLKEITSPIVGTFYRAPAPDQPAFAEIGAHIGADDVVCIVEAMKVMNEIKAGVTGTIRKILVDNASPVEYGQPLFIVEVG